MPKRSREEIVEAATSLQNLLDETPVVHGHRTVYAIVRHVARSGMQREISLHVVNGAGQVSSITWHASCLTGWSIGRHGGVKVAGAGMDMGFHLFDATFHSMREFMGLPSSDGAGEWQRGIRLEYL